MASAVALAQLMVLAVESVQMTAWGGVAVHLTASVEVVVTVAHLTRPVVVVVMVAHPTTLLLVVVVVVVHLRTLAVVVAAVVHLLTSVVAAEVGVRLQTSMMAGAVVMVQVLHLQVGEEVVARHFLRLQLPYHPEPEEVVAEAEEAKIPNLPP